MDGAFGYILIAKIDVKEFSREVLFYENSVSYCSIGNNTRQYLVAKILKTPCHR
jgi:hypothetical protein